MEFADYIRPELLILIPVLYLIAEGIKKTEIPDKHIPWILGVCGIVLSVVYIISIEPIIGGQAFASAFFTAVTQGVLCAGAAVYANQIVKQAKKED